MVDSWYCLDWVVPERMSQVWRRSEVRNHKRRSLNTRLSSGTSANTSCRSRNAPGRMIRSDLFWYGNNLRMKPTYREKNLLDYLFGGFRSTLKYIIQYMNKQIHKYDCVHRIIYCSMCVFFIHVPSILIYILFYFSFIWVHVYAFANAIHPMVTINCGSAFESGASLLLHLHLCAFLM